MNYRNHFTNNNGRSWEEMAGKKILFANFPADGHFNPLTGLAMHLKSLGADVRWYTSNIYSDRLKKMQIPHYSFKIAKDINSENLEMVFPEREKIKGQVKKLNFDMIHAFILRGPEYYADMINIYKDFSFDLVIADCLFTGIPFISDKMDIPVISIGIVPLIETSKDLPPPGLGITPSYSFWGRVKQSILRTMSDKIFFSKPNKVMRMLLRKYGMDDMGVNIFDLIAKKSTLLLQSGTPGFEYYRTDLGANVRFIGSLLPYQSSKKNNTWFDPRLNQYEKVVVVTQGTVEKNTEKILAPTLEAFKNTDVLVVATTGGSGTAALRKRFPQENLIIEDFIPFADIMPYADVYITNGGYGGVMLGIENQLPLVVAGVHEGKNEINARIGYFRLGINLRTEKPAPRQIRKAVEEVLSDASYRENVIRLGREFSGYNPGELCAHYVNEVMQKTGITYRTSKLQEEKIY